MNTKLLKQRDFFLLMLGKLMSLMGTQLQNFALSLYVLKITGSATKFASVLAVGLVPRLILGPFAGVFADWFDRKKIIVSLDFLSGIIVGLFALIYQFNDGLSLIHVYILCISLSLISLLFDPAISTVIPTLVKKDELVDANSINSLIMQLGNFVAPMIAGVLFGAYGLFAILVVNSISFMLSGLSETFINIPKNTNKPEEISVKSFLSDFSEGIKVIKENKLLLLVIVLGLSVNFAFSPLFTVGLTFISKQVLQITDSQFGLIQSILVIPFIIVPLFAGKVSKKFSMGKILFGSITIAALLVAVMALVPFKPFLNMFDSNFIPYVSLIVVSFLIALSTGFANIAVNTSFQQQVPLEMMGRVVAVLSAGCTAAVPLGQMFFGFLFDRVEASICVLICTIILLVSILPHRKTLCTESSFGNSNKSEVA